MLIGFSFENVASFKEAQNLSMEISTLKKDEILPENTLNTIHSSPLLKSTLIYGANASGKTNLIKAIELFKIIVLSSYKNLEQNMLKVVVPFLLDKKTSQTPSVFEITFAEKDTKYRYGIAIFQGKITEEWLYFTPKIRETLLFYRQEQSVEFNKSNFNEIKLFIKLSQNNDHMGQLERVAPHIPLVSVLSVFEGEHSQNVVHFFNKIRPISGLNDRDLGAFTFSLMKDNEQFHQWIKPILNDLNIHDLQIDEEEILQEIQFPDDLHQQHSLKLNIQERHLRVNVKKYLSFSEETIDFPLQFESEGTRKVIHLLGPIYDTLMNGNILFIDEFDSKFHTLLSKHIFKLFHQYSSKSQLIANVQDTNLMDTDYFRRDQIWFVHKDGVGQDSQLYSLAEYKNAIQKSYSEDYLNGAFDAIPLFSTLDEINCLMEES